ncbi:site-specific integrase [Loigolactobacillus backii]|uniref:site-specific integrase n=1 Tax=Loigolactobacillus backii TaxID=375175 RepID=UPI0022FD3B93|nr:site-specific integrase [Loigolactobacillus backii]MDA5386988.1 site-specific integrase [Loigolactobacillus backii]MDA5389526.1 site-specific integrase [Loigolactobacillus backii]
MANIIKRNKGWMARIYFRDDNGKRLSKSKSGFKTKGEAKAFAITMENELLKGNPLTNCETPFPKYFWDWYTTFKKPMISSRTKKSYEYTHNVIKKYFTNVALSAITRTTYQSFLNDYGENHAKETAHKINVHIRACVKNALYDNLIKRDFTEQTSVVYDNDRTQKIEYLNIDEMKRLVTHISSTLNYHFTSKYMILLDVYTGMRLGELQGLIWSDINFNFKTVSIQRAWSELDHDFKSTKNESSKRIIRVNDDIIDCLKGLKNSVNPVSDNQQVFLNQYKTVPTSNAANKTLRTALKDLGISKPSFHFHSLRHTHVAYLLANQIDLYAISKRLGHSDIGTTSHVYSYLIDEYKAKTDGQIDSVLQKIAQSEKDENQFI